MKLRDTFDGIDRFEGDRVLRWRSIPAEARIVSAKATITPIDAKLGGPFAELLSFSGRAGEFGATISNGRNGAPTTAWLEVDFHARRTLASLRGAFNHTTLQVDVGGGTYVEINQVGAFKTPSDTGPAAVFPIDGQGAALPGLTVAKIKVTNRSDPLPASLAEPNVTSITVSSIPTNVSLRVGDLAPFFTHPGEITLPEDSPDFAAVLQAALVNARIENGFYDLLFTVHSDTIARLQIDLEVEFMAQTNPLPDGLPEVVVPFDFGTVSRTAGATINVAVPPNSRVVPGQTTARVRGNFAETRVALGPTGNVQPAAAVEVSPTFSQAQIIALATNAKDIAAVAVDLLLESTTPSSRLRLDVREDLDGKPGDKSLLAATTEFDIDQQVGKGPRWTSVPLGSEFLFTRTTAERYWLVLQSLVGSAAWSVNKTDAGNLTPTVQSTNDGGLSWRDAIAPAALLVDQTVSASGPFTAFFRLRTQPKTFKVPLELQAGSDQNEVRIKLDRFAPLGRVDFALDTELAQGLNESLQKNQAATSTDAQHLRNGEFEHWLRVGDELRAKPEIQVAAPISDVAFSSNGRLVYVLDVSVSKLAFILVFDAECNRQIKEKRIELAIRAPLAFVISPDGTRAYAIDDGPVAIQQLQVVDLASGRALGDPLDVPKDSSDERAAKCLALSPDGKRLFMPMFNGGGDVQSHRNQVRVIDTTLLEQQVISAATVPGVIDTKKIAAGTGQTESPRAMTVSADGNLLYLLTDGGSTDPPEIQVIDANGFGLVRTSIKIRSTAAPTFDRAGIAIVGPDRVVVTNVDANKVGLADITAGNVIPIEVGEEPIDVVVSPEGKHAYTLNRKDKSVSIIDLDRRTVQSFDDFFPSGAQSVEAFAISPQGDQICVGSREAVHKSYVSLIQIGARVPLEWHLTSGTAQPICLGDPFHLVALLGSPTKPTGLSQVMPVSAATLYEFSFWGLARENDVGEPAIAEVFWLGDNCGPITPNPDPIPIKLIETGSAPPPTALVPPNPDTQSYHLQLHRVRMTSPAGAAQAEVRFTVPANGEAGVDQVSLIATSEVAVNSDFNLYEQGRLAGWTSRPANAPGFVVRAAPDGVQLINAGAADIELVQTVSVKADDPFTLEFRGKATAATAARNPRVEVRWLKTDGTPTALSTAIEIFPDGLGSAVAAGRVPGDAVKAEIHVAVSAGTTLEVKAVSLRFLAPTIVPVTFIAEAPGELTVSDIRVAFDQLKPSPPPVPDRGLCVATPPGREPGEDECGCPLCSEESEDGHDSRATPAATQTTSVGPIVLGMPSSIIATTPVTFPTATFQLTDIHGIGEARAQQLADAGIDTVEKLATAAPESVVQIKFITPEMASRLIAQAKALIDT